MRRCKTCGADLSGRPRAVFCDGGCRTRYARGLRAPAQVVDLVVPIAAAEPADEQLLTLEQLARELQRTLRAVGTPPTAKAGLAREYRATLEEIERRRDPDPDVVDELFARRSRRA